MRRCPSARIAFRRLVQSPQIDDTLGGASSAHASSSCFQSSGASARRVKVSVSVRSRIAGRGARSASRARRAQSRGQPVTQPRASAKMSHDFSGHFG